MDKKQAPEAAVKYAIFLRKINPSIKKVYLFGSYAKGTANDKSDIDLAIIFDIQLRSLRIHRPLSQVKEKDTFIRHLLKAPGEAAF